MEFRLPPDAIKNRITYLHILAFCVVLPFDKFYSEIILISLLIHSVLNFEKQKFKKLPLYTFLLPILFFIGLISISYSDYPKIGFQQIEKQLALLLFPLIIASSDLNIQKYKLPLLVSFGVVNAAIIVYLFGYALKIIILNDAPLSSIFSGLFTNQNFTSPIGIHATYFSAYIAVCIPAFVERFLTVKSGFYKLLCLLILLIFGAGLFQLSSRAVFIAVILIINLIIPFCAPRLLKKKLFISAAVVSLIMGSIIFGVESFNSRFIEDLQTDLDITSLEEQVLDPRVKRWESAWTLVEKAPFLGYGNGSEVPLLREEYFRNKQYTSFLHNLNAHNQYLSYLLKSGIVGLLCYLAVLIAGFRDSFRKKDSSYLSFMALITIISFSENILDVNKGIFFFACFFSLFLFMKKDPEPDQVVRV